MRTSAGNTKFGKLDMTGRASYDYTVTDGGDEHDPHNLFRLWLTLAGSRPAPKGSLKPVARYGHVRLVEESKRGQVYRHMLAHAAHAAWAGRPVIDVPVAISVEFTIERPSRGIGTVGPYPTVHTGPNAVGDIDKLLRNVDDALVDARVLADDSLIVEIHSKKVWGTRNTTVLSVSLASAGEQ